MSLDRIVIKANEVTPASSSSGEPGDEISTKGGSASSSEGYRFGNSGKNLMVKLVHKVSQEVVSLKIP